MKQEGMVTGTMYGFSGQFVNAIFSYVRILLLTRILAPEAFGMFSFIFSMVTLVTALSTIGIDSGANLLLPRALRDPKKAESIIANTYTFNLLFIAIGYAAAVIASFFLFREQFSLLVLALVFLASQLGDTMFTIFNSYRYLRIKFWNLVLKSVLMAALPVGLALIWGVAGALAGMSLTAVVYAISTYACARVTRIKIRLELHKPMLKQLLTLGVVLFFVNYIRTLLQRSDVIFLAYFRSVTEVGFYNIGASLAGIAIFLPSAINSIFFPFLSDLDASGRMQELQNLVVKTLRVGFFFLAAMVLLGISLAQEVVTLLFEPAYALAWISFAFLLLGTPFLFLSMPFSSILGTRKKLHILAIAAVLTGVFNVVLNFILIPLYGLYGATFATVIAIIFNFFFMFYYAQREIRIPFPVRSIGIQAFAAMLAGSAVFLLRGHLTSIWLDLIARSLFGGTLFFILVLALRGITWDEIKSILTRLGIPL